MSVLIRYLVVGSAVDRNLNGGTRIVRPIYRNVSELSLSNPIPIPCFAFSGLEWPRRGVF